MEFTKKNPKIYILTGKAQSGKNISANIIKEYYENNKKKAVIISYAKYLKDYAKEIINWDCKEETKPRELLQQLGVELIKNKINKNMLINRIKEDIKVYEYFFDVIIISDARFDSEIEEIKKENKNITVIKIEGKENNLTKEQKKHITETALDNYNKYDYIIKNNKSLENLRKQIIEVIK